MNKNKRVHLKHGGCSFSRDGWKPARTVEDHGAVTCRQCLNRIERLGLKPRSNFDERPEFAAAISGDGMAMSFRCPVCGQVNHHGRGDGHRVSHCCCWERGYFLTAENPKGGK